jgi:hypothetical protein
LLYLLQLQQLVQYGTGSSLQLPLQITPPTKKKKRKEKKHPKFSNAPFSLLAELDHDS